MSLFVISALALTSGIAQAGIIGNGPPNQSGGSDLNSFLEADNFSVVNPFANIIQIGSVATLVYPMLVGWLGDQASAGGVQMAAV